MRKLYKNMALVASAGILMTFSENTPATTISAHKLSNELTCTWGSSRRCLQADGKSSSGDTLRDMMLDEKTGQENHIKEEFYTYVKEQLTDEVFKFEQALHMVIKANIQNYYYDQNIQVQEN